MVLPKRHQKDIQDLGKAEKGAFAAILRGLTRSYDQLFACNFPYSAGLRQAPVDGQTHAGWHWHMVFFPPLLRSAIVKKFMVGYEMLAMPQRDITAEAAAERLRTIAKEVG